MLKNLEADKIHNAEHCEPVTVQIMELFIRYVKEFPAADVQPVCHGRWENTSTPNQLRCSECDVIHFIAQYPKGEINYCPNCGADMRGDTK
jgi:hypothetical protein